ncbi:MAG: hypothetical protein KatS3mg102_2727 [Planctomycetota bacterium]|nr:MAG: hypothetical protein KatS3mg102_2727 [Planctomycetota bacterium]
MLLLRLARIVKFFRFIRFVPNVRDLMDGAVRAMRASVFVLLAFFLFNFVVSLMTCHLFRNQAPEYFGNPLLAFYSTFKVFTIEGWYEIPDAIAAQAGGTMALFTRLYFMVVVIFGGLFGLSLVNAIFVDEMLRNENDLVERRLRELDAKLERLLHAAGGAALPPRPGPTAPPGGAENDRGEAELQAALLAGVRGGAGGGGGGGAQPGTLAPPGGEARAAAGTAG